MVKIYTLTPLWHQDEHVFKNLRPADPSKWGGADLEKQKRGEPLEMTWASDASNKAISDLLPFPGAGLASTIDVVNKLRRFAPNNIQNSILIDGVSSPYVLLQVRNHKVDESVLEHLFMMFASHKKMLASQLLKNAWEEFGLTGAVFSKVGDIDDSRFISVDTAKPQ